MLSLSQKPIEAAEALLAAQREALLSGDLPTLSRMVPDIEKAIARLENSKANPNALVAIKQSAARNAALLQAALSGVSQVRGEVENAQNITLTTYDSKGQAQRAAPAQGRTLSRR